MGVDAAHECNERWHSNLNLPPRKQLMSDVMWQSRADTNRITNAKNKIVVTVPRCGWDASVRRERRVHRSRMRVCDGVCTGTMLWIVSRHGCASAAIDVRTTIVVCPARSFVGRYEYHCEPALVANSRSSEVLAVPALAAPPSRLVFRFQS